MKTRALPWLCLLLLMSGTWRYCATTHPAAPAPDERLALSTPRLEYLLGEPVPLDLVLRNPSKEKIKVVEVFIEPDYYEAPLQIAPAGAAFQEFPRNSITYNRERQVFSLGPGEALRHQYRVVVGRPPEFHLAFGKPGEYRVYAVFPLYLAGGPPQSVPIASNVVHVRIKTPQAEDAKAWGRLNDPTLLLLLQLEAVDDRHKEAPLKMAEILHDFPSTGYAPALRHALAKIYFRQRHKLPDDDVAKVASVLGIRSVASFDDNRLARRRKPPFDSTNMSPKEIAAKLREKRPVPEILRELGESVAVSLKASQEFTTSKAECTGIFVGQCMQSVSDQLEAVWERRGDGYLLVPFQAAPEKPKRE